VHPQLNLSSQSTKIPRLFCVFPSSQRSRALDSLALAGTDSRLKLNSAAFTVGRYVLKTVEVVIAVVEIRERLGCPHKAWESTAAAACPPVYRQFKITRASD
jgi:hypothetical protein